MTTSNRQRLTAGAPMGVFALCAIVLSTALGGQSQRTEMMKTASLIFIGTVLEKGAVTFSAVPRSERTAVVRVDEVLEKPAAIAVAAQDRLTVELADPAALAQGDQATFYTTGWILGEGIAVREVGHEPMAQVAAAAGLGEEIRQARQQLTDAQLQARLEAADLVVMGKVTAVREPQLAAAAPDRPIVTEHDPQWREAVIEVASTLKGSADGEQVVVRFAGSMDVAYYQAPKFRQGEEGVFLLQEDVLTGLPMATLAGDEVTTFVVEEGGDRLPAAEADRVRRLLRGN